MKKHTNRTLSLLVVLALCLSMAMSMITGAAEMPAEDSGDSAAVEAAEAPAGDAAESADAESADAESADAESADAESAEGEAPVQEEVDVLEADVTEEDESNKAPAGLYWWQEYMENPEDDLRAPGVNENGQVETTGGYILFTSDTHSTTFLAKDLLEYANQLVQEDTGDPDAYVSLFAFGGDFADSGLLPDTMTILKHAIVDTSPNTVAVYTKGNHENSFDDEAFLSITGMPRTGETAINEDGLYYFYSFGMTENQTFTQDDIDALAEYLASHNDGKPIFVISHFPIHYLNNNRSVYGAGGKELLDVLNQYPQVLFSWGHNHSEGDPSYGTVRFPGESITYGPSLEDTVDLNFTYFSNGSLRYGVNKENGVLVKVNEDGSVNFRFISLDQYAQDEYDWTDSDFAGFEALGAGDVKVVSEITRPAINDDYYKTINAAQVFIPRPKVTETPSTAEDVAVYNDRFTVSEISWYTDGEPLDPDAQFDFDTAYSVEVTLKAADGETFAEDIAGQNTTSINPVYDGPMDDSYSVGSDSIKLVDATTLVIDHTFANTVEKYDPPVDPATEIEDGHQYVLASIDDTDVSVYYKYEYQEGARRQSYKPRVNDVVIIDGQLVSKTEPFEINTAAKDGNGYILWSDASLLDHGYGDDSLATINIMNLFYRGGNFEIENDIGEIAMYNNWNIDENGLPYVDFEGIKVYPYTTGMAFGATTDPDECNMRLFEVGESYENHYIVAATVAAPVAGETPDPAAVWTPADETFQNDTEYTAAIEVALATPVTDANAAIGRINGKDVDLAFSEDGLTATLTFTFPATNPVSAPAAATAKKADAFEAGKTYVIVAEDGTAVTSLSTADGRFLLTEPVTVANDAITDGITQEMLFTIEDAETEGQFYIKGSRGYLMGRREAEGAFFAWGVTNQEAPGMTVSYADGKFYVLDSGVKMPFGGGGGEPDPVYFYLYDGHVNFADFSEGSAFEIYEVELAG